VLTKFFVIVTLQEDNEFGDLDADTKKAKEKEVGEAAALAARRYILARSHNEQLRVRNDSLITLAVKYAPL
jgi:hypothetical protein